MKLRGDQPTKFKKRHAVVEAMPWNGDNAPALLAWMRNENTGDPCTVNARWVGRFIEIATYDGVLRADHDDVIIKDERGKHDLYKPHIFEETYVRVSELDGILRPQDLPDPKPDSSYSPREMRLMAERDAALLRAEKAEDTIRLNAQYMPPIRTLERERTWQIKLMTMAELDSFEFFGASSGTSTPPIVREYILAACHEIRSHRGPPIKQVCLPSMHLGPVRRGLVYWRCECCDASVAPDPTSHGTVG